MKVAVTGAAGQIGARLCDDLARDHEIVRIDIVGVDVPINVQDIGAFERALTGCDALVDLARVGTGPRISWEHAAANMAGTYNAFEAARRSGCNRVIFASSNHAVGWYEMGRPGIYERKSGFVLPADAPPRPTGLYGVWKGFGEALARYYSDEYGMSVACVRIGDIRKNDTYIVDDVTNVAILLNLTEDQKRKRLASVWMSHADFARLIRAILKSDFNFGIAYGISDNANRIFDLEAGRALFGFWPADGAR